MSAEMETVLATVSQSASEYRSRYSSASELVLVLPRWLCELAGQERLTASLRRLNVQHVKVVEDWTGVHDKSKAQMLLYEAGSWHVGHDVGAINPHCEGCQHVS